MSGISRLHSTSCKLGLTLFLANEAMAFMQGVVRGSIRLYNLTSAQVLAYQTIANLAADLTRPLTFWWNIAMAFELFVLISAIVSVATLRSSRQTLHFAGAFAAGLLTALFKAIYVLYDIWSGEKLAQLRDHFYYGEYLEVEKQFIDAAGIWASPTYTAIAAVVGLATLASLLIAAVTAWKYETAPKMPSPAAPPSLPPTGGDVKFCRMCGAKIPIDSRFCEACGAKLSDQ